MKKFFSLFLMVCMLVTSLSVSASYDSTTNTYTFDTADEIIKVFNGGTWSLADGNGNTTELGELTNGPDNLILGKRFNKVVFDKDGTITTANNGTLDIRTDINGSRYRPGGKDYQVPTPKRTALAVECFTLASMNTILAAKDLDESGTVEKAEQNTGDVVKYTMWAYSALPDGESIVFDLLYDNNAKYDVSFTIPASALYSENGIPHKIDYIVWYRSYTPEVMNHTGADTAQYAAIFIDGLPYESKAFTVTKSVATDKYISVNPHIALTAADNTLSWKKTELHICSDPAAKTKLTVISDTTSGGQFLTVHTRANLSDEFFRNISLGTRVIESSKEGFVTGVDSELASELETLYTTVINGDRVVDVDASVYNNPASIWNDGATESSVSLVRKTDGEEFVVGSSITGTFADYLISVNGVYTKVELAPVSYDIDAKTATVNVSKLPEGTEKLQVVVAAYNSNDTMEAIKVSESYVDFSSNITYKINDTFPTDADTYKVFVFDSLTSAKPLVEALEK